MPAQRTPREPVVATPGTSAPAAAPAAATPQVQLIPASVEGALDAAEEAVDLLLESGQLPVRCW